MKKLIFILWLALVGCSEEDIPKEEEQPEVVEFATVAVSETCPERTGFSSHNIDKSTWEMLYAKINDTPWGSQCLLFEFTNLQKEEVIGYYDALSWPSSWNEE